ncbi:MAG: 4-hydroxy-tetrahydrodipicolinate reductase [Bacteroides sp. SM23_62_1]|nr:MAG: 4-hydroxy-tetrahydrodipicolinate reductase [Bacteroides sp. SM23_62_1]
MKIAIIGYGKMGKMIEETAIDIGHQIGLVIDIENMGDLTPQNLSKHDVAIEFTTPEAAFDNISLCFDAHIPVVSGTTGWLQKFEQVRERCLKENQALVYASNFSIGVNILFALNRYLARIMDSYNQYKPAIEEIHHTRKLDAPSGTAISLSQGILKEITRYDDWKLTDKPNARTIPVKAIRADNIPGIHEITYESDFDTLSIKHSAKGRKGFAIGALLAAEFISDKKGLYSMEEVLNLT